MPQAIGIIVLIILAILAIVYIVLPLVALTLCIGLCLGCLQSIGLWIRNCWRQCVNPLPLDSP